MTPQLFSFLVFVKSTPFLYLEGRSQKKLRLLFEQICYDFYALEGYLANILVLKNDSISYFRFTVLVFTIIRIQVALMSERLNANLKVESLILSFK